MQFCFDFRRQLHLTNYGFAMGQVIGNLKHPAGAAMIKLLSPTIVNLSPNCTGVGQNSAKFGPILGTEALQIRNSTVPDT